MLDSIKKKIHNNNVFVFVLVAVLIMTIIYVSEASSNVPIMDYWIYLDALVEKMYTQGISFSDIYSNNGVHRTPIQLLLFLCNVRVCNLNPQVEIYLGAIGFAGVCCVLYKEYKHDFISNKINIFNVLAIISIVLSVFNYNQWEIITQQFSFSCSLRILFLIISFIVTNRFLQETKKYKNYAVEIGLLYVVYICGLCGMYFLAYGFALVVIMVWDFLMKGKYDKTKYFGQYFFLGVCLIVAAFLYLYGLDMGNTADKSISMDYCYNLIKCYVLMIGTTLTGAQYSVNIIYIVGIILGCFHVFNIYIYLSRKFYQKTYIPFFLFLYCFAIIFVIFIGRSDRTDILYFTSSRYVLDTTLLIVADVWVQSLYWKEISLFSTCRTKYTRCIILCALIVVLGNAYKNEISVAKYRKIYSNNLIEKMKNIDELNDDELIEFQASPEIVRRGIKKMKKYNLGFFEHEKN